MMTYMGGDSELSASAFNSSLHQLDFLEIFLWSLVLNHQKSTQMFACHCKIREIESEVTMQILIIIYYCCFKLCIIIAALIEMKLLLNALRKQEIEEKNANYN